MLFPKSMCSTQIVLGPKYSNCQVLLSDTQTINGIANTYFSQKNSKYYKMFMNSGGGLYITILAHMGA
jgi:hypothetical protein